MNDLEATKLVASLSAAYPAATVAPKTPAAFALVFADVPAADVNVAASIWMRRSRFFPTPSELYQLLLEEILNLPTAAEAWEEVSAQVKRVGSYAAPQFSSAIIEEAVRTITWRAICLSETPAAERKVFFEVYQSRRDRALQRANLPALIANRHRTTEIVTATQSDRLVLAHAALGDK